MNNDAYRKLKTRADEWRKGTLVEKENNEIQILNVHNTNN